MPLPAIDPARYDAQLSDKLTQFKTAFAEFSLPEPAVFTSEPSHYRLRAEFRIWHHGDVLDYAMFDPENPKQPVLMHDFPVACSAICELMPRLRNYLIAHPTLSQRLFTIDFLATLSGEMLVTLIYHRKLDEAWEAAARQLADELQIGIIGRSRGQKIVLARDWVLEAFELNGRQLRYQQLEGSFSQPNGNVNKKMLGWACAQAERIGGDLLELYCGNGNFTIALAPLFDKVLATEVSKTSVKAALYNLEANHIANAAIVRMSSEEISAALAGRELFQRMQEIDLAAHHFSTIFLDPPRSGLDPATLELAAGFEHILYISCNPQTLQENVAALQATHRIEASAVFDQFPYTHHLECGLLLQRR
ncbi:tRNA (uridine(54)-C5)-methyltransferase TrmA [Azonexus sp.]|uniref:tRNA (uridine(54)-C5)-methyltransferase TrmA n=1 Tax=Azonexus sp. TaxID=1872668 RepID=UPI0027BA017A|nr:tRNA (uridine(54)-C5)-methyltransferase TrmA [Azonexus sp.]